MKNLHATVALATGIAIVMAAVMPHASLAQVPNSLSGIPAVPPAGNTMTEAQDDAEQAAIDAAELEAARIKRDQREGEAFSEALRMMVPLTPDQIRRFDGLSEELDEALGDRQPPKASTITIQVTTNPGQAPADILMSDDYITTIAMLDSTGAPWPVARAQAGGGEFVAVEIPESPGNIIILSPKRKYTTTNLSIVLHGHHVPLSLTLRTDRDQSYYNANLVMDAQGPLSEVPVEPEPHIPKETEIMRAILDGRGPLTSGIRQVEITGAGQTTAFTSGEFLYLRTPHTLRWPERIASIRSGRMRVYKLSPEPVITVADDSGRLVDLTPSGRVIIDGSLSRNPSSRRSAFATRQ